MLQQAIASYAIFQSQEQVSSGNGRRAIDIGFGIELPELNIPLRRGFDHFYLVTAIVVPLAKCVDDLIVGQGDGVTERFAGKRLSPFDFSRFQIQAIPRGAGSGIGGSSANPGGGIRAAQRTSGIGGAAGVRLVKCPSLLANGATETRSYWPNDPITAIAALARFRCERSHRRSLSM